MLANVGILELFRQWDLFEASVPLARLPMFNCMQALDKPHLVHAGNSCSGQRSRSESYTSLHNDEISRRLVRTVLYMMWMQ